MTRIRAISYAAAIVVLGVLPIAGCGGRTATGSAPAAATPQSEAQTQAAKWDAQAANLRAAQQAQQNGAPR
ncbi:hypothetical protein CCAX7_24830 [Capsulimonas corticalis]|uniref:Uncharacterized protein n=2 Tax=Capsulimonas corticalis TaxID=2219043 RepID=A0A402CVH1_9BACT|nr:hypothetical protein CCAX7_24830 [Capsulimonas corticalis]